MRVSYRWLHEQETETNTYGDVRFDLPGPLPPGQSISVPIDVKTPEEAGSYTLQVDLVQELVAWFEDKGAKPLKQTVTVQ